MFPSLPIACISVNETAIEKWVGLTRRIGAIDRKYHYDDTTLIRHVYDLNAVYHANRVSDAFYGLAKTVVRNDAQQFKNQYPEYVEDAAAEIKRSLDILKRSSLWRQRYETFIQVMVYDYAGVVSYDRAIGVLEDISGKVINQLVL